MKRNLLRIFACLALSGVSALAQDITGTWQGTLHIGPQSLRIVVQVSRDGNGWKGMAYSPDQSPDGIPSSSLTLDAGTLKYKIDAIRVSFEGKLSADGKTIAGNFTQGGTFPLELQ